MGLRFQAALTYVVGQLRSVQGSSDLNSDSTKNSPLPAYNYVFFIFQTPETGTSISTSHQLPNSILTLSFMKSKSSPTPTIRKWVSCRCFKTLFSRGCGWLLRLRERRWTSLSCLGAIQSSTRACEDLWAFGEKLRTKFEETKSPSRLLDTKIFLKGITARLQKNS
ncbi:hypothetical protein HA466_0220640 [Hirschfeldia incana]|nr:hypothetical protein HA466_0220640 [Hirschfeldia incana]